MPWPELLKCVVVHSELKMGRTRALILSICDICWADRVSYFDVKQVKLEMRLCVVILFSYYLGIYLLKCLIDFL